MTIREEQIGPLMRRITLYEGRECYVADVVRVRNKNKAFGFYNVYVVRFLDGTAQSVPAARFNTISRREARQFLEAQSPAV